MILRGVIAALMGTSTAGAADLTLEFRHLWKGEPLKLEEPRGSTQGDLEVAIHRLAYLLSDPAVIDVAGTTLEREDWFGLIEAADTTSMVRLSGLPPHRLRALEFSIGLNETVNAAKPHQYPANHPLNPVRNNLHWSWQGGYIFLAVEGRWRSDEKGEGGFSYHLGNTPHLMRIRLPMNADLSKGSVHLVLACHLDRVFDQLDLDSQSSTHGRVGDALAMTLKERVEGAFEVVDSETSLLSRYSAEPTAESARPPAVGTPYALNLKHGFPIPPLPTDYPLTTERVELGRRLFHDATLSRDSSVSCASCHDSKLALSDPRQFSVGIGGQKGARHAMPLLNLAWKSSFFWDGRAPSLRAQALMPIQDPTEMDETLENVEAKLARHPVYPSLFKGAFGSRETSSEKLGVAIEQFLLTQTSLDSRFDRAMRGEEQLSGDEKRGFELFFTEYEPRQRLYGADCFHCHGGAFFTDHGFHNNGLDFGDDLGLGAVTGRESDNGKFSTPSLRNVALTAPYMHDGRFETLEEVMNHYTAGIQRSTTLDPNLAKHPAPGLPLSDDDQAAIIAFLKTLTDPKFEAKR